MTHDCDEARFRFSSCAAMVYWRDSLDFEDGSCGDVETTGLYSLVIATHTVHGERFVACVLLEEPDGFVYGDLFQSRTAAQKAFRQISDKIVALEDEALENEEE